VTQFGASRLRGTNREDSAELCVTFLPHDHVRSALSETQEMTGVMSTMPIDPVSPFEESLDVDPPLPSAPAPPVAPSPSAPVADESYSATPVASTADPPAPLYPEDLEPTTRPDPCSHRPCFHRQCRITRQLTHRRRSDTDCVSRFLTTRRVKLRLSLSRLPPGHTDGKFLGAANKIGTESLRGSGLLNI
jgi:hypothetical protein